MNIELKLTSNESDRELAKNIVENHHSYVPTYKSVGRRIDWLIYIDDDEKQTPIALLGFNDSTTNNLAPQVYGDTNGRTRSYAVSQTYTFTFNTYSLSNALTTKINKAKYGNESKEDITYRFTLRLSDGSGFTDWKFKLVNATYSHTIGNIDAVSYTFTL